MSNQDGEQWSLWKIAGWTLGIQLEWASWTPSWGGPAGLHPALLCLVSESLPVPRSGGHKHSPEFIESLPYAWAGCQDEQNGGIWCQQTAFRPILTIKYYRDSSRNLYRVQEGHEESVTIPTLWDEVQVQQPGGRSGRGRELKPKENLTQGTSA